MTETHFKPTAGDGTIFRKGRQIDLAALTRDELHALLLELANEQDGIVSQIDRAKVEFRTTGNPADPAWFLAAKKARRIHGRQLQAIQRELSKKGEALKTKNRLHAAFVALARERLIPGLFHALMEEAKQSVT